MLQKLYKELTFHRPLNGPIDPEMGPIIGLISRKEIMKLYFFHFSQFLFSNCLSFSQNAESWPSGDHEKGDKKICLVEYMNI